MTRKFVYSIEAQAELREIVRHTARQWGAAQARSYARQIDEAAGDLATGQGFFKEWGQLLFPVCGSRPLAAISSSVPSGRADRLWF